MDEKNALLEIQERDLMIMRLEKQLDEMPEKRAILAARGKLEQMRLLLRKTEHVAASVAAEVKRIEDDTIQLTEKMESEQAKLLSGEVTVPKELQAISMELDGLRRRKEQLENEEMARMSQQEAAEADSEKVRAAIAAAEAREVALVDEFKSQGSVLLGELERLRAERDKLLPHLSKALADRYEALRGTKHGIGAGRLEDDMCGVCRVTVPAGRLSEMVEGPPIAECPNCGRLLVVECET